MSIRIIPKSQQGYGAFNGGEIVENKPIGFPQDHSNIPPYSNLFYWAHARAVVDSTIGLHPHKGFEICSFVLKGEIRHYDTKLKEWRPLQAGDVQIIRAGNGISHSEWMGKDAEMFQIWLDPDLTKTLEKSASYDDYKAELFPVSTDHNTKITKMVGEGSPFTMDTPGVEVIRFDLNDSAHKFETGAGNIYSLYIIDGAVTINGQSVEVSDYILVYNQDSIELASKGTASVFMIASPLMVGYKTYMQLRG
jgi:hypothetical protein